MTVVMRNTQTGEVRVLEGDSQSLEYRELANQRRTDTQPMWEETGIHDAVALKERIENGTIRAEDIGDEGQPTNLITGDPVDLDITPSSVVDRGAPTLTELASGAGRAALAEGEEFEPTRLDGPGDDVVGAAEGTGGLEDGERTRELTNPEEALGTTTALSQARSAAANDEMEDDDEDDGSTDDLSESESARVDSLVEDNSLEDLQKQAESAGLPHSGTKADIAERLVVNERSA